MCHAEDVGLEDELSDFFGQFVMILAGNRLRRGLHLFGWPYRMWRVLEPRYVETTLAELQRDLHVWNQFDVLNEKPLVQHRVHQRSVFQKLSVQQLVVGMTQAGFRATPSFLGMVRNGCRLRLPTQGCEELIGVQKNRREAKVGRRFRRPEYSMGVAIKGRVLEERRNYITPQLDAPMVAKPERLVSSCFLPNDPTAWSLGYGKIPSLKQLAGWYSPSAQNLNTPHADLQVLQVAWQKKHDFAMVGVASAFLCVFDIKHRFVFRLVDTHPANSYYLPLNHFRDSAVLAWPCREAMMDGGFAHFELDVSIQPSWSLWTGTWANATPAPWCGGRGRGKASRWGVTTLCCRQ